MSTTSIQWTSGPNGEPGYTFNPWLGCSKVHTGCTNCYAEKAQPVVMRKGGGLRWGEVWQGGQRVVVSDSTWKKPFQWAREAAKAGERRKVFCASLADVLEVPSDPPKALKRVAGTLWEGAMNDVRRIRVELARARERLWDMIRKTAALSHGQDVVMERRAGIESGLPGLDWLLLTKRPENWHLVPEDVRPFVWLGTSIADQRTAEEFIPLLLVTQGFRYRFISAEPLLGPVDLHSLKISPVCDEGCGQQPLVSALALSERCGCTIEGAESLSWDDLDWIIIGGESGPDARLCDVGWIRGLVEQCDGALKACFVKQLGATPCWPSAEEMPENLWRAWDVEHGTEVHSWPMCIRLDDSKGGDWSEWPEALRVRQWPNAMSAALQLAERIPAKGDCWHSRTTPRLRATVEGMLTPRLVEYRRHATLGQRNTEVEPLHAFLRDWHQCDGSGHEEPAPGLRRKQHREHRTREQLLQGLTPRQLEVARRPMHAAFLAELAREKPRGACAVCWRDTEESTAFACTRRRENSNRQWCQDLLVRARKAMLKAQERAKERLLAEVQP